jgi:hypothetical protein
MSSTMRSSFCSGPCVGAIGPDANWIDACDPSGVNCTARVPGAGVKSMSSRQPRRS